MGWFDKKPVQKTFEMGVDITNTNDVAAMINAISAPRDNYLNVAVYRCINYIADQCARIPFIAKNDRGDIAVAPLIQKLMYTTNNYASTKELLKHIYLVLIAKGIVYVWDKDYLQILKNEDITQNVRTADNNLLGVFYKNAPGGYIPYDDLIVIKLQNNPVDALKPYSMIDILAETIKLQGYSVDFLTAFFRDGGFVNGFFQPPKDLQLTVQEAPAWERMIDKMLRRTRAGKAGFSPFEYKPFSASQKDNMTLEVQSKTDEIIARSFGVPNSMFNKLTGTGSYALSREERQQFYYDVMDDYIASLEGALNQHQKYNYDRRLSIVRDVRGVPYLQSDKMALAGNYVSLVNAAILNPQQACEAMGFEYKPVEIQSGTTGTETPTKSLQYNLVHKCNVPLNVEACKTTNNTIVAIDIKTLRDEHWKIQTKALDPVERDLKSDLQKIFGKLADTIGGLATAKTVTHIVTKAVDDEELSVPLEEYAVAITAALKRYYNITAARADKIFNKLYKIGVNYKLDQADLVNYITDQLKIVSSSITETTAEQIKSTLAASFEAESWTSQSIANDLKTAFDSSKRAMTIARTETNKVFAHVTTEKAALVAQDHEMEKAWSSAKDENVRPSHANADNQGWINIDDVFELDGGTALAPHDESLPADEVINCRCAVLYKIKEA